MGDRLRATAARLGADLDEVPDPKVVDYLHRLLRIMYVDMHHQRHEERAARAAEAEL